ncbi:protein translocase subunit SecF [Roseateles asaccharophilus]|uniref:Protein-export membrane protein SecF n=1 Tax=Roseateles asaccharophilus TaxID=582607 RepID=A0ABU2A5Y5_9BURK|nr:protein translocase subunit SecF [Roseateles asaccharophilus]MDR7332609.1 preprotein translocase subunit SecF [Roseateles asaccharophilus]
MELFRIKRDIPFMKHALILNVVSFLTFAAAVFFLVTRGLHFSIEFTGGTVIEVAYPQAAEIDKTRHIIEKMGYGEVQVTNFGSSRDVMIRLPVRPGEKQTEVVGKVFTELCKAESGTVSEHQEVTAQGEQVSKQACAKAGGVEPVKLSRSEVVGPAVGAELALDAAKALGMTVIGIMIYLAIRFEWKFAVAGIIANLHDVVIILGFFAFFQWEFSLAVLAAILAVLGYSVNESVVIFDRVREAFRKFRKLNTHEVIDHAITSTISRTIITHGSTQLVVLSMLLFGGPTLHYFAVALTIGILFGIYSSVFVAAAIAMWLGVKREDLVKAAANRDDPNDPNAGAVV